MAEFKEDFSVSKPCIWNGHKEALEVTDLFPTGNKSNRYFQIQCPDCWAKQTYQIHEGRLYLLQSVHPSLNAKD